MRALFLAGRRAWKWPNSVMPGGSDNEGAAGVTAMIPRHADRSPVQSFCSWHLAILQLPMKAELGVSTKLAEARTGLAFAVWYATLGLPAARIGKRALRKDMFVIFTITWSVMTAFAAWYRTSLQSSRRG